MPIPGSANHRIVFATYLDAAGDPAVGFLLFYPSLVLTDAADTSFITTEPLRVELDNDGYMAADLMCTDDPDLQPAGWVWRVEEHIPGGRRFSILVPNGTTPIPLTGLGVAQELPANVGIAYVPWAAVGQPNGVPPLDAAGLVPPQFLPGTADIVIFSSTAPSSPDINQLWWNTLNSILYRWDGSTWVSLVAQTSQTEAVFTVPGPLGVGTQPVRYYMDDFVTVDKVRVSVGGTPVGADVVIDVLKNGTSIFPNPLDKPTIAPGVNTAYVLPLGVTLTVDDYLEVAVDQVGSTSPGTGLVAIVRMTRAV